MVFGAWCFDGDRAGAEGATWRGFLRASASLSGRTAGDGVFLFQLLLREECRKCRVRNKMETKDVDGWTRLKEGVEPHQGPVGGLVRSGGFSSRKRLVTLWVVSGGLGRGPPGTRSGVLGPRLDPEIVSSSHF